MFALGCGGMGAATSQSSGVTAPSTTPPAPPNSPPPNPPSPPSNSSPAVVMWKYDQARTGLNDKETRLTINAVSGAGFGRLFSYQLDGEVFAQPLYVSNLSIGGNTRNVIFIASEHDSVYAFDADLPGDPLWKVNFTNPPAVITVPNVNVNDPQGRTALGDEVGITGTPVIDVASGTLYVSAMTWENNTAVHRLHALDISTGAEKFGGPVEETATVSGSGVGSVNGQITFEPVHQNQRAGLVLSNGLVYVSWGSFSDVGDYHGWMMAFDAKTLMRVAAINLSPGSEGAAVWQGGGAPAVDADGYLYVATADGHNNHHEGGPNWGDSLLKLKVSNGQFTIADWFTPFNEYCIDINDMDLGSGAPMLLPDGSSNVASLVVTGKEGRIYLVDRNRLGNFTPGFDSVLQTILVSPTACDINVGTQFTTRRMYGAPAFWNNTLYVGTAQGNLLSYKLSNGQLAPASQSADSFAGRGPIPVVSANGAADAIVWIADYNTSTHHTTLKAYDATDLTRVLYQEDIGAGNTFTVPLVISGKVYVAKQGFVLVYGLR